VSPVASVKPWSHPPVIISGIGEAPIGQQRCLNGIVAGDKFARSGIVDPTSWQRINSALIEAAVRPEARQARLRSGAARRRRPPRKHNATAKAVEGNLGGFCVHNSTKLSLAAFLGFGRRFYSDCVFRMASVGFSRSSTLLFGRSLHSGCPLR
jgi:hypothetical protein